MAHDLDPYPSPEGRDRELATLVEAAGGELRRYGHSVEGRPLLAARIPRLAGGGPDPPGPARVLCTGNIHGLEYVSSQVVLGLLRALEQLDSLRDLRRRAELWLIPCLNPDGYARVWERAGRGDLRTLRTNTRGVDLNRNFPLPPGAVRRPLPGAGSPRIGARTYHGPAPLSEPETRALADLLAEQRFAAGTNGHSFMGRLIPPRVRGSDDYRTYADLCRYFAEAQPRVAYPRLASRLLDTFTGELEDFQHHLHGTWAVCVETFPIARSLGQHLRAPSPFWRFNPRRPAPWVDNDVPGVAAFLHAALTHLEPGRRGRARAEKSPGAEASAGPRG
jgi:hypothetical protein